MFGQLRIVLFGLLVIVLLGQFSTAEARRWTRANGRTFDAEFSNLTRANVAEFRGSQQGIRIIIRVPLNELSEDDRKVILRQVRERSGATQFTGEEEKKAPPKIDPEEKERRSSAESFDKGTGEIKTKRSKYAIYKRTWRPKAGGSFEGLFSRHDPNMGYVYIQTDKGVNRYKVDDLTTVDRDYIEKVQLRIRNYPTKNFSRKSGGGFTAKFLQAYQTEMWFSEGATSRIIRVSANDLGELDVKMINEHFNRTYTNTHLENQSFRNWGLSSGHELNGRLKAIGKTHALIQQDSGEIAIKFTMFDDESQRLINSGRKSKTGVVSEDEDEDESQIDKLFSKFNAQTGILIFGMVFLLLVLLIVIKYVSESFRRDPEDQVY